MDPDFALWGFILGSIGTAVSIVLGVIEIRRALKAKPESRERTVQQFLQRVVSRLRIICDPEPDPGKLYESNRILLDLGEEEFGLRATFEKVCPEIDGKFLAFLSYISENRYDSSKSSNLTEIMTDQSYQSQALVLKRDVDEWLKKHV